MGSNSRRAPQGAFGCRDWAGCLGISTLRRDLRQPEQECPVEWSRQGRVGSPATAIPPCTDMSPAPSAQKRKTWTRVYVLHLYFFSFTRNSGQEAFQTTEQLFQHQTSFKCEIITDSIEVAKIIQRGLFPQFPQRWLLTSLWYHRKIRKLTLGPPGALGFIGFACAHSGGTWRVRAVLSHVDSRDQHHHHDENCSITTGSLGLPSYSPGHPPTKAPQPSP